MDRIRVNTGIKIEVNDDGECISINAEDTLFRKKYEELVDSLDKILDDCEAQPDDLSEEDAYNFLVEKCREMMAMIDKTFGEDTCRKVFGDIVPSPQAIGEFFELIAPIVQKYGEARNKKINKQYNVNRKGGKK